MMHFLIDEDKEISACGIRGPVNWTTTAFAVDCDVCLSCMTSQGVAKRKKDDWKRIHVSTHGVETICGVPVAKLGAETYVLKRTDLVNCTDCLDKLNQKKLSRDEWAKYLGFNSVAEMEKATKVEE